MKDETEEAFSGSYSGRNKHSRVRSYSKIKSSNMRYRRAWAPHHCASHASMVLIIVICTHAWTALTIRCCTIVLPTRGVGI